MSRPFGQHNARLLVRPCPAAVSIGSALDALAPQPHPFVLESASSETPAGRYSILGCDPVDEFVQRDSDCGDWVDRFRSALDRWPTVSAPEDVPFPGGWVGFVGYEAGAVLENVRPRVAPDVDQPVVGFRLYDSALIWDHARDRCFAVAVDWPHDLGVTRPAADERMDRLMELACQTPRPTADTFDSPVGPPPVSNMTHDQYLQKVRRILDYIAAGDAYQVNLTQRFTTPTAASPLELYRRLRRANPAAYAAWLGWGNGAILSSSPELFLDLRDGRVVTRPIKGTRPRIGDSVVDAAAQEELLHSEKDAAELTMIIDLLRNDLGRVCEFGSIHVESASTLETHPTVYHLSATIVGTLRDGVSALDLLRAASPGGSVTGCPKIRAMQIINELEPSRRNVYCGSIGYLGLDGSMCMNIAIRTMILDRGKLHLHAGGAIVADSDPQAEYEETLAKARGMFRALGYENPGELFPTPAPYDEAAPCTR